MVGETGSEKRGQSAFFFMKDTLSSFFGRLTNARTWLEMAGGGRETVSETLFIRFFLLSS